MKCLSVMIKPAAGFCNMRCSYCFYADVLSHRTKDHKTCMTLKTAEIIVEKIFNDLDEGDILTISFQGGEPTLAGLKFYQNFTEMIEKQQKNIFVNYAFQTNGLLINEKWCRFFKDKDFLLGLSIDGFQRLHDKNRVDIKGEGTFDRIMKSKKMLDDFQIPYNILCVLTEEIARHPKMILQFLFENQINYIQFIPCLASLEEESCNSSTLTPARFFAFYNQLLDLWLDKAKSKEFINIRLFDDLIRLLVQGDIGACGLLGECSSQYVIEADGEVYPCDFYAIDQYASGNLVNDSLQTICMSSTYRNFKKCNQLPLTCQNCDVFDLCKGGCKRMRESVYIEKKTGYCGYRALIEKILFRMNDIMEVFGSI